MKTYGFGADPVARTGVFASSATQFLLILLEGALAVWLLSDQRRVGSWLAAMLTFGTFAAISFFQGLVGQASCGCLGRNVTISPWVMFGVDLVAVAALLLFRPATDKTPEGSSPVGGFVATVAGVYVILMGAGAAAGLLWFGSIDAALAGMRGERLSVQPALVDVGVGAPGETLLAKVRLINRTDKPIRVIGGTSDCSCTVIADLPVDVAPGETRSISVAVRLPNAPGLFNRPAGLEIDDAGLIRINFRLTGRIKKASR